MESHIRKIQKKKNLVTNKPGCWRLLFPWRLLKTQISGQRLSECGAVLPQLSQADTGDESVRAACCEWRTSPGVAVLFVCFGEAEKELREGYECPGCPRM